MLPFSALPAAQGLYQPDSERDACGLAMVADLQGRKSHATVEHALTALHNLRPPRRRRCRAQLGRRRGPAHADPGRVPARGRRGSSCRRPAGTSPAWSSCPTRSRRQAGRGRADHGRAGRRGAAGPALGWRELPTRPRDLGPSALRVMPRFPPGLPGRGRRGRGHVMELERRAFCLRKRRAADPGRGLRGLPAVPVGPDDRLQGDADHRPARPRSSPTCADERVTTAMALVHSRFSTNTFPSWPLAHPFRYIAHNGEINTIKGNRNWMRAREALLETDLPRRPVPAAADPHRGRLATRRPSTRCSSCCTWAAGSLPHAVLMMIPEAWENHTTMDPAGRRLLRVPRHTDGAWDGPACVAFTDGTVDRRGAGPQRPAPGPLVGTPTTAW